jgi:hypothetical protein
MPRRKDLEDSRGALKRTRADLAEHKKTLDIIINICFSFVNRMLGGAVESKNMTFVMPRSLQTL